MSAPSLGLALGTSFAAGLNVYATIATLGLLHRFEVVALPPSLAVLAHPVVLTVALALYVVEFFADKIPVVDHIWDAIHAFVRPPAAAVLAYAAVAGVPEPWRIAAALLAGTVALASHGGKATARVAVNMSPEPFSTWAVSLGEDALAISLTWLAATHPELALALVLALTIASIWVVILIFRLFRGVARRAFGRRRRAGSGQAAG
jgi:hypothetical protein